MCSVDKGMILSCPLLCPQLVSLRITLNEETVLSVCSFHANLSKGLQVSVLE